jgi:hypothetical protein
VFTSVGIDPPAIDVRFGVGLLIVAV